MGYIKSHYPLSVAIASSIGLYLSTNKSNYVVPLMPYLVGDVPEIDRASDRRGYLSFVRFLLVTGMAPSFNGLIANAIYNASDEENIKYGVDITALRIASFTSAMILIYTKMNPSTQTQELLTVRTIGSSILTGALVYGSALVNNELK